MTPDQILFEADRCVKCGLCLPYCPTYRHTLDEAESPRGRIALIQAATSARLESSDQLTGYLDHCLGCRACEQACPSKVRYGQLIDGARAQGNIAGTGKFRIRQLLLNLAANPKKMRRLFLLSWLLPKKGLGLAARVSQNPNLERLYDLMPNRLRYPSRWRARYLAENGQGGKVGLFVGCVSQVLDQPALQGSIKLLTRLGKEVVVPPNQGCCGALHQHGGNPGQAKDLARNNRQAFAGHDLEAIVNVASGCGSQLGEYAQILDAGSSLPAPLFDISDYLNSLPWPEGLELRPLPHRVAVHDPCSLRNVVQAAGSPYRLLERIPEINLFPLPGNDFCCGAGGINMLTQAEMADELLAKKLKALEESGAKFLVTSNTSCSLHIAAGIRRSGWDIEVLHPVELLARQIPDD